MMENHVENPEQDQARPRSSMEVENERIEEVAGVLFASSGQPAFTSTPTFPVWTWEMCDDDCKRYWRNLAKIAWNIFNRPSHASDKEAG